MFRINIFCALLVSCVRSSHNLFLRAHVLSLEGTLVTCFCICQPATSTATV